MPGTPVPQAPTPVADSSHTIIDLTHPLANGKVPACCGHPCYSARLTFDLASGDFANVHTLTLGSHTGTHIDAPYHFFLDGCTVDQLELSTLCAAPAIVVDLRHKGAHDRIEWADLSAHASHMRPGAVLLLCTGWSKYWATPQYRDHPFLDPAAATRVMEMGVRVLGTDTLSPDEMTGDEDTGEVHRVVLGKGGVIVENLTQLDELLDSRWRDPLVSLLPLNLAGCDGSPIRAVAWEGRRDGC
ncbi:putative cyclase [Obba rivulosa]|uniref:Putative cyclase n=1 Tax=Obba rivulosa TaxID=1052685 RepID=A0A8E2DPR0_9APHY|nr:putative cyclase [Obba rivulosa]